MVGSSDLKKILIGLREFIPEELLAMFDENELEVSQYLYMQFFKQILIIIVVADVWCSEIKFSRLKTKH